MRSLYPTGYKSEQERLEVQARRRASIAFSQAKYPTEYIPEFGTCLLAICCAETEAIWRGLMLRRRSGETPMDTVERERRERAAVLGPVKGKGL